MGVVSRTYVSRHFWGTQNHPHENPGLHFWKIEPSAGHIEPPLSHNFKNAPKNENLVKIQAFGKVFCLNRSPGPIPASSQHKTETGVGAETGIEQTLGVKLRFGWCWKWVGWTGTVAGVEHGPRDWIRVGMRAGTTQWPVLVMGLGVEPEAGAG